MRWLAGALIALHLPLAAQVYSPKLLRDGQPDSTDLQQFTTAIYARAHAVTPRAKAEAIWRFFLTDGRFVQPGFWYHIAGWTYEEPSGEVLDPLKLLNSYGFGLCYHIAPLLEAVFKAGGFQDARTWFLTGHTVAEVFYEGKYHYFDSDMMGYNVAGDGPYLHKPVAGVRDLERDPGIILTKLSAPTQVKPGVVDSPWYPADVQEHAMGGLADLFSTASDNYLYTGNRYSVGHRMDFVLRPGEKLIRFFQPEQPGLFYLPYHFDGKRWAEFPQEIAAYKIRTIDGPRSQKDGRHWATGRIEYQPPALPAGDTIRIDMPSPYVIIDAEFALNVRLGSAGSLHVDTSTNGGASWDAARDLHGPFEGLWKVEPKVLATSAHGRLTAVSGSYGYLVRITKSSGTGAQIDSARFTSRIQLNPRSLPAVEPGNNRYNFTTAPPVRRIAVPAPLSSGAQQNLRLVEEHGQRFLLPENGRGEVLYSLDAEDAALSGFDIGARFLNLRNSLAPDKLTAETRPTAVTTSEGSARIEWSTSPGGPFHPIYESSASHPPLDHDSIDRVLNWPEVFRHVPALPAGTKRVFVRIKTSGPAIDNIRLALYTAASPPSGSVKITQVWKEKGQRKQHVQTIPAGAPSTRLSIDAGADIQNESITFSLAANGHD